MSTNTQDIVFAVLFSVVLVFNIAGNSLVIYIITNERGRKTSATNYLLLNLAGADLLFGVFLAPEYIFLPFFRDSLPDGVLGDWLCKILFYSNIAILASKASIITVICLSVERYFAVCRPHVFSQRFSPKIVKVLVVVSWIYAVVLAFPSFVYIRLNREYHFCDSPPTTLHEWHSLFILIESVCFLVLMVFLLVKICISLWCKQTVEPTGEREIIERKKKKKVTLCVLAVVVTFIVCWIPVHVYYIIIGFQPSPTLTATVLLALINTALDPYLFSFQCSRLRILVKKLICCKKASSQLEERE